jgi:hypothetical protein
MTAAIVQIVPPGGGGLSDCALVLAERWREAGTGSVTFALAAGDGRNEPLPQRVVSAAGGGALAVLLHYSGYGYGARGLCGWLADELEQLRHALGSRLRLVVAFHELFARGEPPWRSAFWLSPWQAAIARRLALLADAVWTNAEQHARWLAGTAHPDCRIHWRPVFSNVGEPPAPNPLQRRSPRAVLFGSAATRGRAAAALRGRIDVLRRLGIEALVEVGSGPSVLPSSPGLAVRHLGLLPAAQLGALLGDSRLGIVEYPGLLLAKSGVFAAYAAHGCAALNLSGRTEPADALAVHTHYLTPSQPDVATLQDVAQALGAWYRPHASPRQAGELLRLLLGQVP